MTAGPLLLIAFVALGISIVIGSRLSRTWLALTIIGVCYHAVLGLQVVIEDYVHAKAVKLTLIVLIQFAAFALAAAAIVSLLVVAFAG